MSALRGLHPCVKLVCLVAYVCLCLHAKTAMSLALCFAMAVAFAAATRMRLRDARAALRPLAPIVLITAVMQALYFQNGRVLASAGPFALTAEALGAAGAMVVGLASIMVFCIAFMRCSDSSGLARALRWALGPLRAMGLRVDAFMFSLEVAMRFVPVLVDDFRSLKNAQMARCGSFDGRVRDRLGAYMRLFAPLIRSAYRRADALAEASVARCFCCGAEQTEMRVYSFGLQEVLALSAMAALAGVAILLG